MNTSNGTMNFEARLRLDQLERDLEKMRNTFQRSLQSAEQESNKLQQSINNVTKGFLAFLSIQQAQQFVADIVRVRSEFQKTEITFQTMLKSKEKSNVLISEMVNLASKTPFSLQDVNEGAKRLLAFQVPAKEVTETLRRMGDVASGLGVPMGQLIHVYGQVKAQGRLMTNDLYQFMNAGIPIIAELSKVVKKSEQEIKEMVSQGKIGFSEIQQVIQNMTNQGGLFYNLMAEQSKTLDGQISNLKDNISSMMNEIGKSGEGVISQAISSANYLVENYKQIGKIVASLIATYGSYRTAVMSVAVAQSIASQTTKGWTFSQLAQYRTLLLVEKAQKLLNATMLANPYILATTAVIGLVAVMWSLRDSTSASEKALKEFNKEQAKIKDNTQKETNEMKNLLSVIKDETNARAIRTQAYNTLISKFPNLFSKYKTEEDLLRNIEKANKDVTLSINERIRAENVKNLQETEKRKEQALQKYKEYNQKTPVTPFGSGADVLNYMYASKEMAKAQKEDQKIKNYQKKIAFIDRTETEAGFKNLSFEQKQQELEKLRELGRRRRNLSQNLNKNENGFEKENILIDTSAYEKFQTADVGYLASVLTKQLEQDQKHVTNYQKHSKELFKKMLEAKKHLESIKNIEGLTTTQIEEEHKTRKDAYEKAKKDYEDFTNEKTDKSSKNKFDNQAHLRKTQQLEQEKELAQQKAYIEAMQEGYEKELALIDFYHKEKDFAIRTSAQDMRIALEKERKDSNGQMTQQAFDQRLHIIDQIQEQSHQINLNNRQQQEDKLLKNLLEKYQTFEEKKAKIAKEFDEQIAVLQKKNIDGIYDKNINEAQKKKQEALLQAEFSSSDANTAISNLFGNMSKKSIEDLEALQTAGEEAFEKLKSSGTLGVETLKSIEDKLKSNKQLIRNLSPIFKQLALDFKTLGDKNASKEDKNLAFEGINQNIQKSTQALVQFGDVLKDLGNDTLSQIANQLNEITQKASGYASILKSVGAGGGMALGIGAGIGVLTSIFNHFAQARRNKEEAERRWKEQQIEHEKKLAELEHQRILQMKQYSNVFVQNKMGRHIEQLNEYKKGIDGLGSKLRKLQNMEVWDRTEKIKEWFPNWYTIYKEYDKNFFKPFKEKYGKIIDDFGNINYELLEKLNPNSREFQHSFDFINGHREGSAKFIEDLKKIQENLAKVREELDKYVENSFGELGNNFANNIITSVQKGTNAFENFGSTVSNVMRNLINQMLVTDKVKKMFDDFNKSIGDIYARNLGVENTIVFEEVKNKTIEFVNQVLKPEIQKGEALTKNIFDELEKQGVKMYDEQTRQAQEKGLARISQDSADELNGQFRLMTEMQKQKLNVSTQILEKSKAIADSIKMLQQNSAQQLKHLAGIEVNTFQLHEMKKDIAGMKAGIDDITTKGIKIR